MGVHHATRCRLLLLPRLVTCLLLMPLPLSCSASSVITHLPGYNGRLPFYLETGYISVEEKTDTELFYYFAESEGNPSTDPVLLWLTGGPRCSGFSGLAFEVGPITFAWEPYNGSLPQLVYNQYSWTKTANIIFLDSPVGSGFSYARDPKGYNVGDVSSSLQVVTFLMKWFNDHPHYLSNPFFVGGSSYGGKMTPLITQYISEGIEQRRQPLINLKGYMIGNPITGSMIDKNIKVKYAHGVGLISDQQYEAAVANCNGNYLSPTNALCAEVLNTINNLMSEVEEGSILDDRCDGRAIKGPINDVLRSRNLQEHSQLSELPVQPGINCVRYGFYLADIWMNNNSTREALQIKKGTLGEWLRCQRQLPYAQDVPSSIPYQFNLTKRGYRALVYSGDHDLGVPFLGTHAWVRSFNFSIVDDWRAWHVGGQAGGFTIEYANNLTFATIKGAGHVAAWFRPKQGFAMAQRWLHGEAL